MTDLPRTIFFDEAGYTGNNLSDTDQPFFAFAAVQIENSEATAYLDQVRSEFGLVSTEIKGGRLCRKQNTHRVVAKILQDHASRSRVILCHKAFGLAAKLFEYLIEPIISPVSSAFYNRNFHQFVANGLYCQGQANDGGAELFLRDFQRAMIDQSTEAKILQGSEIFVAEECDFSKQISTLVSCHPEKIREELESLRDTPIGRWRLDLSATAIWSLLRAFGTDMKPIIAVADASKPLDAQKHFLDSMIGRDKQAHIHAFGATRPLLFNLAQPVSLVDSLSNPGIQIADVFASATVYALKHPDSDIGNTWRDLSGDLLADESILPDLSHFDLTEPRARANATALHLLIDHSITGVFCIADWPELLAEIDHLHGLFT